MRNTTAQKYEPMSISDGNGEDFIATASPVGSLSPEATLLLEVIAPATLPEGYTFEAEANGTTIMVTVPAGGVEEGEKISVPFASRSDVHMGASVPPSSVPVRHWKDDLCAFCGLGCFHPVLWNACCCPFILLGQVMHRLKLTSSANEGGSAAETASTFRILFNIGIVDWILRRSLPYLPLAFTNEKGQPTDAYYMAQFYVNLVLMMFAVILILLTCKTRKIIRKKYQIPSQQCHGCEDFCCAFWCTCCTVAQMARHTGDYDSYQAMCCSETGLPPHAPHIV